MKLSVFASKRVEKDIFIPFTMRAKEIYLDFDAVMQ